MMYLLARKVSSGKIRHAMTKYLTDLFRLGNPSRRAIDFKCVLEVFVKLWGAGRFQGSYVMEQASYSSHDIYSPSEHYLVCQYLDLLTHKPLG